MNREHDENDEVPPRAKAAQLVALDALTDEEIAAQVGISRSTLKRWKAEPEFMADVESFLEAFRAKVRRQGIAILERRVQSLNNRWRRLEEVMRARAEDPSMQHVPGGNTGLLVRTYKQIGSGESAQIMEEYEVDAALLREFREHEKQAAQELGQWIDKKEHAGVKGSPLIAISEIVVVKPEGADEPPKDETE